MMLKTHKSSPRILALLLFALFQIGCVTDAQKTPEAKPQQIVERISEPFVLTPDAVTTLDPENKFLLGLEREIRDGYPSLFHRRVAVITKETALDSRGNHLIDLLAASRKFTFVRVFLPEGAKASPVIASALEKHPGIDVVEFTAETSRPDPRDLEDIGTIVFDMALAGPRTAPDTAALGAFLEEASLHEKHFVVFDRPTASPSTSIVPPSAYVTEEPDFASLFPLPLDPAMTSGELATLLNREFAIQARLEVVKMENWKRADGNEWMTKSSNSEKTPEGGRHLETLKNELKWKHPRAMLGAIQYFAGNGLWTNARMETLDDGTPVFTFIPVNVPQISVLERLSTKPITGISAISTTIKVEGENRLAVTLLPSPDVAIDPAAAALKLRLTCSRGPDSLPPLGEINRFGNPTIDEALQNGIDPATVSERLASMPVVTTFADIRTRYLLYPQ